MTTLSKARELAEECLNELYLNSEPSISWEEIVKKYKNTDNTFYDKHFISEKKYDKIVNKYKKKLGKWHMNFDLLNYAPVIKEHLEGKE